MTAKPECRCVVRLKTSVYATKRGLRQCRDLNILRKQSFGWNALEEEISASGDEEALARIKNFDQCEDGVYEVVITDVSRDWETGYIDDWELELRPTAPTQEEQK